MKKWFYGSLVVTYLLGFVVGCTAMYKPDIEIKDSKLNTNSGNKGQIEGSYHAK